MSSITHIAPAAFTDPNKLKLYLDPGLNKGSLFLFDFTNPISNPNPDGTLANGATFKNLVDGGADGVYTPGSVSNPTTSQAVVASAANKAGLTSTGTTGGVGSNSQIALGSPQPTADKPFYASLWMKGAGAAYTPSLMMGDAMLVNGAAGSTQWAWALYQAAANAPQIGQRIVGQSMLGPILAAPAGVRHLGIGWAAGTMTAFLNGAPAGQQAGIPSPIGATGVAPFLAFPHPGTYYRAYMERLDLSGRTALAAAQADYATNNGRFA